MTGPSEGVPVAGSRRPTDSWRARRTDASLGTRRARRLLALLGIAALLALLAFVLLEPFRRPRTALVLARPAFGEGTPLPTGPPYAEQGLEAVAEATERLLVGAPIDLTSAASPSDLFGPRLRASYPDCDVLLLLVRAETAIEAGRPALLWGTDPGSSEPQRYPVRDLLANLEGHPAAVKVLLLDIASPEPGRGRGNPVGDLGRLLAGQCRGAADGVWVLASHSSGERSHDSSALGRSVFGYWLERGLTGAADRDGDGFLRLGELRGFLAAGVSEWVSRTTAGRENQTPVVHYCGRNERSESDPLLLPAPSTAGWRNETEVLAALFDEAGKPTAGPPLVGADDAAPTETSAKKPPAGGDKLVADGAGNATASVAGETSGDRPEADLSPAELLRAGWTVRDELESGQAARPDPRRDSPHLWHAYVDRLMNLERAVLAGSAAERAAATRELRRLVPPLVRWAGGDADPDAAEPARALMADRPSPPSWQATSFGLAEAQAAAGGLAPPTELTPLISAYDRLLAGGSRDDFVKRLAEAPPSSGNYSEMILAGKLAAASGLTWDIVRQALKARRFAERLAATTEAVEWLTPAIKEADALRRAGERLLLDGVGENRQVIAGELLAEAEVRYRSTENDANAIRHAIELRNDLYQLAPEIVDWCYASRGLPGARSPDFTEAAALLDVTGLLASLLEAPGSANVTRVHEAAEQAGALLERVLSGASSGYIRDSLLAPPDPAEDFVRATALLATALPSAADRQALFDLRKRAERSLVTAAPLALRAPVRPARMPAEEDLRGFVELEYHLAALAAGGEAAGAFERLSSARRSILESPARIAAGKTPAHTEFESALEEFWRRSLPAEAAKAASAAWASDGRMRLSELRTAERALRLLDARDALRVPRFPTEEIRNEALALVLSRQAERIDADLAAAPPMERDQAATPEALREAAARIGGREVAPPPAELASIEGTSSLTLETEVSAPAELTVRNLSDGPADVRLVVDYDPDLVTIERASESLTPAYRLSRQIEALPGAAAEPATLDRPDRRSDIPPAFRLPAGGSRAVTFRVSRRSGGAATRIILRAIAQTAGLHESSAAAVVRNDVIVRLPTLAPATLVVEGRPGTVATERGRTVLAPFPNRVTTYRLLLAKSIGGAATVDVSLFAVRPDRGPQSAPTLAPEPSSDVAVDPDAAASVLARWTNGTPLFSSSELALPADGTPVALPFPKWVPGPPVVGPAIEGGLLAVLTDRTSGRKSFQLLEVRPQHPRRYLEPSVSYDSEAGRVEISVAARDPGSLPPDGSSVVCEVEEPLSTEATRRLEGTVGPGGQPARLFAEVAGLRDQMTLRLSADGYPRAFLYRVPLAGSRSDLLPETGEASLRVLAPEVGAAYRSPVEGVPVVIQVDAPLGTRWDGGDLLEVGLDIDRDRELDGERTVRLRSDRQITATIAELGPAGSFSIDARVADFRFDLPADHLQRGRVNVIGRLVSGGRETWGAPVEVVIDDETPSVGRVLLSSRRVVAGEPLRVAVEASDDDLSGIAQVLVGVDLERTGEFAAGAKPVAAVNENGRWVASIDTAGLLPGPYFVLVRAIDEVETAGAYARERFEIVTPEQIAADRAAAVNRVTGFVNYRGRSMAGSEVTLEPLPPEPASPAKQNAAPAVPPAPIPPAQTDAAGLFEFPRVPPGRYRISAEGLYANRRRTGTAEIDVAPAPAEIPPVEIEVDPR